MFSETSRYLKRVDGYFILNFQNVIQDIFKKKSHQIYIDKPSAFGDRAARGDSIVQGVYMERVKVVYTKGVYPLCGSSCACCVLF